MNFLTEKNSQQLQMLDGLIASILAYLCSDQVNRLLASLWSMQPLTDRLTEVIKDY